MSVVASVLNGLALYLAAGVVFAVAFVVAGLNRVDRHAANGSWGFRLMILPGAVFLWPLLLRRWVAGAGESPVENNAHRARARARVGGGL